jgi:hypothetical protein
LVGAKSLSFSWVLFFQTIKRSERVITEKLFNAGISNRFVRFKKYTFELMIKVFSQIAEDAENRLTVHDPLQMIVRRESTSARKGRVTKLGKRFISLV